MPLGQLMEILGMTLRKTGHLLFTALLVLAVISCRSKKVPSAVVKEGPSAGCDMAEMEKASDEASKKTRQCLYDSLRLMAQLTTGEVAAQVGKVFLAIGDIYGGLEGLDDLVNLMGLFFEEEEKKQLGNGETQDLVTSRTREKINAFVKIIKAADRSVTIVDNYLVERHNKESAPNGRWKALSDFEIYSCIRGEYDSARNVYSFLGTLGELQTSFTRDSDGRPTLSADQLINLWKVGSLFTSSTLAGMNRLLSCVQALNGERSLSIEKLKKGIHGILVPVSSLFVIAKCGVDLTQGGLIVYKNTRCLIEDVHGYYSSRERLENARDHYVDQRINTYDINTGQQECMLKYGIFLNKQPFYTYWSRSNGCRDYCRDTPEGRNDFHKNIAEIISHPDDRAWCQQNLQANVPGQIFRDAIIKCVSYCCNQDTDCVTDAMK